MRRFRFRLEKLLEIRKYREREWELKLAHITGVCLKMEWEIKDLISEKKRIFGPEDAHTGCDIEYLKVRELYIRRLEQNAGKLAQELMEKEAERERIRLEYKEVSKKRKILEKLKERREKEDKKKQYDKEIKTVDDINISNYTR